MSVNQEIKIRGVQAIKLTYFFMPIMFIEVVDLARGSLCLGASVSSLNAIPLIDSSSSGVSVTSIDLCSCTISYGVATSLYGR